MRPLLVICGSHTFASTAQVRHLADSCGVAPIVIPTDDALADPASAGLRAIASASKSLDQSGIAIIMSERDRRSEHGSVEQGARVMAALMHAARALVPKAGTVISKGGITSAAVASEAFGAREAHVRGQITVGVSVWTLGSGRRRGTQIIVPGNVGEARTLTDIAKGVVSTQWKGTGA